MSCFLYVSRATKTDLAVLESLFTTVGDVISYRLELIPDSGQQSEFGIFEMANEQQALDCMERFNGYLCDDGRHLSVVASRPVAKLKGVSTNGRRKM